jgi:uncharacterized protein YaaW (UPF0174 family)
MIYEQVDLNILTTFLKKHALIKELDEIAKIIKVQKIKPKDKYVTQIATKFYKYYHTPAGYRLKKATLDKMCARITKKMKLKPLEGSGWQQLHSLSVNVFEKLLETMKPEEKQKLLDELWKKMSPEDKKKLKEEFNMANISALMESSGHLVAHIIGIQLARETALFAAAAIIRVNLGAELTVAASTVLTRTATVFLGPIGWALIVFSFNDMMGTNYKRVVPALLLINIINVRVHTKKDGAFLDFLKQKT